MTITYSCGHRVHFCIRPDENDEAAIFSLVKWVKEQTRQPCPACRKQQTAVDDGKGEANG